MDFLSFPARLRSGYNNVEEYGTAQVAGGEDAVDFTSAFIPLLPLGSQAVVEWVLGQSVVQAYAGRVYLSSPGLLRLVGVEPALVADTRALFATNIQMPATVLPPKAAPMPAKVVYLALGHLTLQVPEPVEPGGRMLLNAEVDFLTLRQLPLQVRTRVTLRKSQSLLLCSIQGPGNENLIALSAYVARLEKLPGRE